MGSRVAGSIQGHWSPGQIHLATWSLTSRKLAIYLPNDSVYVYVTNAYWKVFDICLVILCLGMDYNTNYLNAMKHDKTQSFTTWRAYTPSTSYFMMINLFFTKSKECFMKCIQTLIWNVYISIFNVHWTLIYALTAKFPIDLRTNRRICLLTYS